MSKNLNRVRFCPLRHFFAEFFKILDKRLWCSKIRHQRARIICPDTLKIKARGLFFLLTEILIIEENGAKTSPFTPFLVMNFGLVLGLSPTLRAFILHF